MKRFFKKVVSISICLCFLLPFFRVQAFAATSGFYEYYVTGSSAIITGYTGTENIVNIPATLDGYTVTAIGYNGAPIIGSFTSVFGNDSNLTQMTIPDSVTSIGYGVFYECTGLTSIIIPNSVTSIGDYAFGYCNSLTNIIFSNSLTSIGYSAFEACIGLTSITIPDSVTNIRPYAFEFCTGLTSITIPDSVTTLGGGAFYNCTNLSSAFFNGNAPTNFGGGASEGVFAGTKSDFTIYYFEGKTGWTTPKWPGPYYVYNTVPITAGTTSIPSSTTSISFEKPSYTANVGDTITVGGNFSAASTVPTLQFTCSDPSAVSFGNNSIIGIPQNEIFGQLVTCEKAGTYIIVVRTSDGALATTNLIISSGTTPATPPTHTTITLWGVATTGNVNDTIYTSADITSPIPINASTFSVICSDPTAVKFGTLQFSSGTVSYHTIVSIPINCIKAGTYTLTASTTDGAAQTETLTISNGSSTPANNYYNTPQQSQTPADYLKGTINAWLIAVSGYAGAITSQCQAVLNQSSSTSGTPSDSDAINSLVSQMQMDVTGATSDVNYYCSKALVALFSTVAASDNIDLSNIDVSNEISAATTIIKDVGKAFKTAPFKQKYGPNDRYIIEIQMTSFDMGWNVFGLGNAGAFYGSIYCTDSTIYDFSTGSSYVYKGAFGSNINQTENAIKDFMGQLNQLANNADNNAVSTVISSLAGYTGMGTLATSAITPLINSKLEALKFGNVSKTLQSISDYYSYVAKVLSPPSDSSILQYAQDITSQANSLAFNDPSGITIPTILNAYDQLNNATQTVYKAAADYINGQTPAPDPNKPKTSVSDSIWSGIKSSLKCPVDIAVYDQSGTEVGYVTGNNVSYSSGIYIEKDGDVKTVYSDAGENITIKAIGTAYGTMDYTIEEYVSGQPTSRLNFYDIRIGVGTTIIANVPTNPLAQVKDTFTLTGDDGTIKPDEYYAVTDDAMVTINTTATAGGTVYSSRTAYTKGDLVRLTALTSPGYIFIGWYNGNQWVSNYAFYEFSARENMNLTANFVDLNLDSTTSGTNLITVIPPTTPNVITITDPFVYAATFDNTPVGATLGTDTDSSTQTVDKTQADAVIYAQDKTLNVGDPFVFMNGVTAKDNGGKGKDITKKVRLSGVINTKVPGKYTMHYSVKGKNGNVVSKDVTITVK